MVGDGLYTLGQQDLYLTSIPTICFFMMSGRKYNKFEIIFDDKQFGRDIYYSNLLIDVRPIKLNNLNDKPVFIKREKFLGFSLSIEIKIIIDVQCLPRRISFDRNQLLLYPSSYHSSSSIKYKQI